MQLMKTKSAGVSSRGTHMKHIQRLAELWHTRNLIFWGSWGMGQSKDWEISRQQGSNGCSQIWLESSSARLQHLHEKPSWLEQGTQVHQAVHLCSPRILLEQLHNSACSIPLLHTPISLILTFSVASALLLKKTQHNFSLMGYVRENHSLTYTPTQGSWVCELNSWRAFLTYGTTQSP